MRFLAGWRDTDTNPPRTRVFDPLFLPSRFVFFCYGAVSGSRTPGALKCDRPPVQVACSVQAWQMRRDRSWFQVEVVSESISCISLFI